MFRRKVFAYECGEGDKGIIIAKTKEKAAKIFLKEYPDRKIVDDIGDYDENGAFLFEVDTLKNNQCYIAFPW